MPRRAVTTQKGLAIALLSLLILCTWNTIMGASNALGIRDNCRRVAQHSDNTRGVLQRSLIPLEEGELDDDFRRIYGFMIVEYKGEELPNWQARKQQQIDRLTEEVSHFTKVDCTVTIIRWIKGD